MQMTIETERNKTGSNEEEAEMWTASTSTSCHDDCNTINTGHLIAFLLIFLLRWWWISIIIAVIYDSNCRYQHSSSPFWEMFSLIKLLCRLFAIGRGNNMTFNRCIVNLALMSENEKHVPQQVENNMFDCKVNKQKSQITTTDMTRWYAVVC